MEANIDAYNEFLDWTRNTGLINPVTVKNWQSASRLVWTVLTEAEKIDLRLLDLDSVITKFTEIHGHKYHNAKSISDYKSRLSKALAEFDAYLVDPAQYKPIFKGRNVLRKTGEVGNASTSEPVGENETTIENRIPASNQTYLNSRILVPVPIRPGLIVEIRHLPSDLSISEADKISAVIKAFAIKEA